MITIMWCKDKLTMVKVNKRKYGMRLFPISNDQQKMFKKSKLTHTVKANQ